MCGRFALYSPASIISDAFSLATVSDYTQRFNIAPGQEVLVIRAGATGPEADFLRWGLVPFWAKDPAIGNRMINARAETITEKPSFRQSFQRRRCLIPADGFFEWQPVQGGKQPWYIHAREPGLLAFAGLWDSWDGGAAGPLQTCTIITTAANDFMRPVHQRMPLMLARDSYSDWLAADTARQDLQGLLVAESAVKLTAVSVSRKVNNPVNDEPGLIVARDSGQPEG
jgi:putative SOS response-associated peptidase YedK